MATLVGTYTFYLFVVRMFRTGFTINKMCSWAVISFSNYIISCKRFTFTNEGHRQCVQVYYINLNLWHKSNINALPPLLLVRRRWCGLIVLFVFQDIEILQHAYNINRNGGLNLSQYMEASNEKQTNRYSHTIYI